MSEYNDLFDFGGPEFSLDAVESEYLAPPSGSGQSDTWTAPVQPPLGVMAGDAAAQLQLDLDSATPCCICAVCREPYPTDSALHQHAIEAQHQAYKCKCGTGFNKASALKRHIETKDAPKAFACTLCYDKFTRKDKLKDHCRHYHKVSDPGLQFLFNNQQANPRAGPAGSRRRRQAPVSRVAAPSGSPASPAHAPAPVGPSVWSSAVPTGRQHAAISAGPSIQTGLPATTGASQFLDIHPVPTGQFLPSAEDAFAIDPALEEKFSDFFNNFMVNDNSTTSYDGFNF